MNSATTNPSIGPNGSALEHPPAPKHHSQPERRLLRLKLAATYLSLSTWTLRSIIQKGELPIVRYGENAPWLVDVRDLDDWVSRHKETL